MVAGKYAILYATAVTVWPQSKVLQDNTTYCSSDLGSVQPLGFEINLSDHRLFFSFFFYQSLKSRSLSLSLSLSHILPPPSPTPPLLLFPI